MVLVVNIQCIQAAPQRIQRLYIAPAQADAVYLNDKYGMDARRVFRTWAAEVEGFDNRLLDHDPSELVVVAKAVYLNRSQAHAEHTLNIRAVSRRSRQIINSLEQGGA